MCHLDVLAVTLTAEVDDRWAEIEPIRLGVDRLDAADRYVCVVAGDRVVLRADVFLGASEFACIEEAVVWGRYVVVGVGEHVHLVDVETRAAKSIALRDYFCGLWCLPDCLLVASGSDVIRVELDGRVAWASAALGIDGVIIHAVEDGVVSGDGEWDPPGGWVGFRVGLADGRAIG